MIIDVHVHAFPKDIREARGRFFEGEPAFQLLYDSKHKPRQVADLPGLIVLLFLQLLWKKEVKSSE